MRITKLAVLALLLGTLGACTHVAPYERGALAQPTMATSDSGWPRGVARPRRPRGRDRRRLDGRERLRL